jgi:hypothetical protein
MQLQDGTQGECVASHLFAWEGVGSLDLLEGQFVV